MRKKVKLYFKNRQYPIEFHAKECHVKYSSGSGALTGLTIIGGPGLWWFDLGQIEAVVVE